MSDAVTATLQDSTTQALEQLNARTVEQQRRLNEARAREHVGAAGWLQSSLLEEIIRVGREQFASTDALRQVVRVTTESLRQLPISAGQESRDGQQRALEGIVASGSEQITAAHELEVDGEVQAIRSQAQTQASTQAQATRDRAEGKLQQAIETIMRAVLP